MVNALHLISVQRGYDPRDFVLVGFGGAGPVHANAIQRDCELPTLVIPPAPGIFSATGLLGTDLKRDSSHTLLRRLEELDVDEIERAFAEPRGHGRRRARPRGAVARADRLRPPGRHALRRPELRAHRPAVGRAASTPRRQERSEERFHGEHDRVYGFSAPCRARRARQPPPDDGRADREAAPPDARALGGNARRRRSTGGVLRRGRRLRRLPHPRPVRASAPAPRSAGRPSSRSSTRRLSSTRASASRSTTSATSSSERSLRDHAVRDRPREGRHGLDAGRDPSRDRHLSPCAGRRAGRRPVPDDPAAHARTTRPTGATVEIADFFTPRGYAVVLQDMRDRYRSEGTGDYYHVVTPHTGEDGYDTVEWIAAQVVVERARRHGRQLVRRASRRCARRSSGRRT